MQCHRNSRGYALAIWGGKAVVVNEQPSGPVNDRVRVAARRSGLATQGMVKLK